MAANSKEYKFVLDMLLLMKTDPSAIKSTTDEIKKTLEAAGVELNIDLNSDAVQNQIKLMISQMDILDAEVAKVSGEMANTTFKIDPNSGIASIDAYAAAMESKIGGAIQGIDISQVSTELNTSLNNVDFSKLDTALTSTLLTDVNELGSAFQTAFNEAPVQAIKDLGDVSASAFGKINTEGAQAQIEGLNQEYVKVKESATSFISSGQASLKEMEANGQKGTAAYRALEEEVNKAATGMKKMDDAAQDTNKAFDLIKDAGSTILGVFGGNLVTQGIGGVTASLTDLFKTGKDAEKFQEDQTIAFKQAGLSGKALEDQLSSTESIASELGNQFNISGQELKKYSAYAASVGGATGESNKKLVELAIAVNKASNGMIDGNMAIKTFSKGLGDPEAQANLGRLKAQFPALATALKGVTDPAQLTNKALAALTPTLEGMAEAANSPIGSMERMELKFAETKKNIGIVLFDIFAPLATAAGDVLIPALQGAVNAIQSTGKFLEENKVILEGAGIAIAALGTAALITSGAFTNMFSSISGGAGALKNFGASTLDLVKSIFMKQAAVQASAISEASAEAESTAAVIAGEEAKVAAIETETAAQEASNAAMVANPIGIAIAGTIALVGAYKLISDSLKDTNEKRLKEKQGLEDLTQKQIDAKEKEIDYAQSKVELVKGFENAGSAAMDNKDKINELAKSYPGVIDITKSYEENLKALKDASAGSSGELKNLNQDVQNLANKKMSISIEVAKLGVAVQEDKLNQDLTDALNKFDWKKTADGATRGGAFGALGSAIGAVVGSGMADKVEQFFNIKSSSQTQSEAITKKYMDAINNAKNDKDLQKAVMEFQGAVLTSKDFQALSPEEKQKYYASIDELGKKRKILMEQASAEFPDVYKNLQTLGLTQEQQIEFLKAKYQGLTNDQIQAMIDKEKVRLETQNSIVEAIQAQVNKYAELKKGVNEQVAADHDAIANLELKKLKNEKLTDSEKDLLNITIKRGQQALKDQQLIQKADTLATQVMGTNKKTGQDAYEVAKAKYELNKSADELELSQFELSLKTQALQENRKITAYDELLLEQKRLDNINQEIEGQAALEAAAKRDAASTDKATKAKGVKELQEATKLLVDLQNKSVDAQGKMSDIKIKITTDDKETQKKLNELEKTQIEWEISVGIRPIEDFNKVIDYYKNIGKELSSALAESDAKLNEEKKKMNDELSQAIIDGKSDTDIQGIKDKYTQITSGERQNNVKLLEQISSNNKTIYDAEKKGYTDRLALIEEQSKQDLEVITAKYDKDKEIFDSFNTKYLESLQKRIEATSKANTAGYDAEEKAALDALDAQYGKLKELTPEEASYEAEKLRIQTEYNKKREDEAERSANKIKAIQSMANGIALEMEREKALGVAKVQLAASQQELALLEKKNDLSGAKKEDFDKLVALQKSYQDANAKAVKDGSDESIQAALAAKKAVEDAQTPFNFSIDDKKQFAQLSESFNTAKDTIDKGGMNVKAMQDKFQGAATDIFAGMFTGNTDEMKDSARTYLSELVGVLEKYLSAFVAEMVLSKSTVEWLAALPFGTGLLAVPLAYAMIDGAVRAAVEPLFSDMLSFGTGGRVDSRTLAIVGDDPKGGSKTEWILDDSQLRAVVSAGAFSGTNELVDGLARVETAIRTLNLTSQVSMGALRYGIQADAFANQDRAR